MYVAIAMSSLDFVLDLTLGKLAAQIEINKGEYEAATDLYTTVMSQEDPETAQSTLKCFVTLEKRHHQVTFAVKASKVCSPSISTLIYK